MGEQVLVIDDDPQVQVALQRGLSRLGYEVAIASDGEAGRRAIEESAPAIVLTDVQMPKLDGHTLLRRIAARDLDTAVIVMTAHGGMEDVIDVLRNGAVDYLRKPWTASELMAAVGRALEVYTTRKAARAPKADEPAARAATDPILAGVIDELRRGEIALPPVPVVVGELRSAMGRRNTSTTQIAALIERDPRVATHVVKLANSAGHRP